MFGKLFRRSSPRPTAKFALRLEALDGRVLPGGLSGGAIATGGLAAASQIVHIDPQSGEEIPQTGGSGGHVHSFASRPSTGGDVSF